MAAKRKKKAWYYPSPREALIWIIVALCAYGLFRVGNYLMYGSRFFEVQRVEVTGNSYIHTGDILKLADLDSTKQLFKVDLQRISKSVLENPYIIGVSVSRIMPATLLIDVQEREPLFYVVDKSLYMVDGDAVILKKLPEMAIGKCPIVTGKSAADFQQDSSLVQNVVTLVQKIRTVDNQLFNFISEISVRDDAAPEIVLIRGAARVVLGEAGQYQRLYILREFLNRAPIIEQLPQIERIDLRFKNRIVVQKKA